MAWLTTYNDTNKIVDSVGTAFVTYQILDIDYDYSTEPPTKTVTPTDYAVEVTVTNFRYIGMDFATASSCKADMEAEESTTFVELVRENDAGAYTVRVTQQT